jgi:DNA-directed RNA polymerase specialized sigma24 family protein
MRLTSPTVERHEEVRVDGDFTAYVAARRPRLVRTAVLLGCPESDAEDIVQTALARCLRSWRRVAKADNRDAYVNKVLVNSLQRRRPDHRGQPAARRPLTPCDITLGLT